MYERLVFFTGFLLVSTIPPIIAQSNLVCRADIAFVVDNSGSIRDSDIAGQPDNFDQVLEFMRRIVQAVTVSADGNRIASVSFGNRARVNFLLNQYTTTQQVVNAISSISYLGGNTNTTGALRTMRQQVFTQANGDRSTAPNVCLLITDGLPTREVEELPGEVQTIKNMGIRIIGVGVTAAVNDQLLKSIVSNPNTDYFYVSQFAGLIAILDATIMQACRTETPQPSTTTGPTPPSFSTFPAGFTPMVSQTTITPRTLAPGTVCDADIAFVVDNSGSIRDSNVAGQTDNFVLVLNFMRNIVQTIQASTDGNHFASVSFGNDATVNFFFNTYRTTAEVLSAISSIPYLGGNTNTTGALRLLRQEVFTQAKGDRLDIPNICILITDGIPTREVEELPDEVQMLKNMGTRIIGVGVSAAVNELQLKSVVSNPATDYFYVSNFTGLYNLLDAIINRACTSFPSQPSVPSTSPVTTNTRPVSVSSGTSTPSPLPQSPISARTAPPGSVCDTHVSDIAFVVDSSGSIRDHNVPGQPDNFDLVLNFMRTIVQTLSTSADGNHFASVNFGSESIVNFLFKSYTTTSEILAAISRIAYLGGNTNTTGALRVLRTQVFTESNGDRPNVPNLCLLITDGVPTREVAELPAEVQRIKSMGTRIIGVGVTKDVNETQLKTVVSNPATDYFYVSNFTGLYTLLDSVINSTCISRPSTLPSPNPISISTAPQPSTARDAGGNCPNPVDIIFVLDDSGSIVDTNYNMLKSFIGDLVDDFDVEHDNVRVGLLTFSDDPQPRFNLNVHKTRAALKAAINQVPYMGGKTNTAAALKYVRMSMLTDSAGARTGVPKLIVVVTDGGSSDKPATQNEAYALRNTGATIVVVAIGQWTDMTELNNIASYPYSENRILVSQYSGLPTIKDRLSAMACSALSSCERNPCKNGGTCLQDLQSHTCLCPPGNAGSNCEHHCPEPSDMTFIVDASQLVGPANFQKQLDFVRELVLSLNVNSVSRVALVVASDQPYIRFNLNDFDSQQEILNGISQYYPANKSDLAGALRLTRTQIFGSSGDRPNVPNKVLIITYRGSINSTDAATEARLTRDGGAHIFGVGFGSMVKTDELNTLVTYPPASNAFYETNPNNTQSLVATVSMALCNEVNECSSNPCQNGGQCTDEISGYKCNCTDAYTGNNCTRPGSGRIDLNIILDSSGSIRSERFPYVVQFIAELVEQLEVSPDKTRIGLIQYSTTAFEVFRLSTYNNKQDVLEAVRTVQFIGARTNAASALELLIPMFSTAYGGRPDAQDVALVFSDGNWNENVAATVPASVAARVSGVHIIVIGIGADINYPNLEAIASQPLNSTLFQAASAANLRPLVNAILTATSNDVNDCATNPCLNGGTCIDDMKRYICRCSRGYTGLTCNRACSRQMDVTIILDQSESLVDSLYNTVTPLANLIVQGLPIQSGDARVSVITYSSNATVVFNLNTYNTAEDILNALSFSKSGSTRSNLQGALRLLYTQVYTPGSGDRDMVSNIVVCITDGLPTRFDTSSVLELANNARAQAGVDFYMVALGDNVDNINALTNRKSDRLSHVRSAQDVNSAANEVLSRLCSPTLV